MRILAVQLAPATRGRSVPRFEPQLGTLLALLRERGHEVTLLGLARFELGRLKAALAKSLPQLIYADIAGVCADVAARTFGHIAQHEFLPIVAGGTYATIDPSAALSLPGVVAVAIGEPDATLVTYLERLKDPAVGQVVSGVWLRDERGLERPQMPPLVEDLDSLPFAERELFGYGEQVRRTGVIEVAIGRGCPQHCAYCVNARVRSRYGGEEQWARRRSPENILDEIDALRSVYQPVQLVQFIDHQFALDPAWLDAFLGVYVYRCALPFRCHVRLNAATAEVVKMLAEAGCRMVDLEVINGSDFIRNEMFAMQLSNAQIETVHRQFREAGIQTRVIVYLGGPYEGEVSMEDTRRRLQRLRPDAVDVRPYYPFPGTDAADTCREYGWLHARGEELYHQDKPGTDMPACRPAVIAAFVRRLRAEFPTTVEGPWWRRWSHASRAALQQFLPRRNT